MAELIKGVLHTDITPDNMARLQEALQEGMGDYSIEDVLDIANWAEFILAQYIVLKKCLQGKAVLVNSEAEGILWENKVDWSNAPIQSVKEAERIFAETRRKIGFTARHTKKLTKGVR